MAEHPNQTNTNWIRDRARNAITASGINRDEAMASRLRDAKTQREANSDQHQERMRIFGKMMSELNPRKVVSLSRRLEQSAGTEREAARPTALPPPPPPPPGAVTEAVSAPVNKRKISVPTRSDNGPEKKAKVKACVDSTKETASTTDTTEYFILANLPDWYTSISMDSRAMKELLKKRPPTLTVLYSLKGLVDQYEKVPTPNLYDKIRDCIHKAEITLPITQLILRRANILSSQHGLPRIFTGNFPADLKADSYQLYKRWITGDVRQSLLRGIVSKKSHSRNTDSIDPAYRSQFPNSAKYIGHGTLVQGQWWPTQLCAVRDGAHGAPQGGICGDPDSGAYSIVLSSGTGYEDADDGDTIQYSGTPGHEGVASDNTKSLFTSRETGHPVRVLRSAQLPKKNLYRPDKGLRYDGLYTVVGYEVLDEAKAMYRFRLERCKGQMEIRYKGKAKRPTVYEVREYERLKEEGAW